VNRKEEVDLPPGGGGNSRAVILAILVPLCAVALFLGIVHWVGTGGDGGSSSTTWEQKCGFSSRRLPAGLVLVNGTPQTMTYQTSDDGGKTWHDCPVASPGVGSPVAT
jgi:Neuraminidase (sialidase)